MSNARFSIIPGRAVDDEQLSDSALRTLNALGMYGDKQGWCFPGLAELAKHLHKSKQAISKDIQRLKQLGYLNVIPRYDPKKKGRISNLIQIKFDYPPSISEVEGVSTPEVEGVSTPEVDVNAPINDPIKIPPAAQKAAGEKPAFVLLMEHFENVFAEARGCDPPDWKNPKAANKRWRTPLKEIWMKCGQDMIRAENVIKAAVAHMREQELTFDAPDQIAKTAASIAIDMKTVKPEEGYHAWRARMMRDYGWDGESPL